MANLIQDFKDNCSNFLYIFIADDAAREVFANAPVILKKRQNQIAYVTKAAQLSKYSYDELKKAIGDEIVAVYGKAPGEVLLDIATGKNVYSLREVRQRNNVSGCRVAGAVDKKTGLPIGKNPDRYDKVYDSEDNLAVAVVDYETGEQVSYYDAVAGIWKAGTTPTSDKNSKNMWLNNIDWSNIILAIINLIGSLFGVQKAKNMAVYQTDGWYGVTQNTTQNSTNNVLPILLLGVAGYMLVTNNDK